MLTRPSMRTAVTSPWSYLFVLQELDLQLAGLNQQRDLAERLGGGIGPRRVNDDSAAARRALPLTEIRIQELQQERASVSMLLPPAALRSYQRLKDRGVPPPWVARTSEPRCPGCNAEMSLAAIREARIDHAPMRCESCWRLLCWVGQSGQ